MAKTQDVTCRKPCKLRDVCYGPNPAYSDAISKGKYRYLQYRYIRKVNIDITDIPSKVSDISI